MNLFVLFSLYVCMCSYVTDIWWKFHVNSTFRNIFTEKNGDVFNNYFTIIFYFIIIMLYITYYYIKIYLTWLISEILLAFNYYSFWYLQFVFFIYLLHNPISHSHTNKW